MSDAYITFIQTGGTIDKDYPKSDHGYDFAINEPAVRSMLHNCHAQFKYDIMEVLKKDSLDITETDRKKIVQAVAKVPGDRIVITHGTDTIYQTAEAIHSAITDKTIILTGALRPEKFAASDAEFNVGMAVGAAQSMPHGVYIALYGRVVPWSASRGMR